MISKSAGALNFTQQFSRKRFLATVQSVDVTVLGIVLHSVDVVSGGSNLESVQKLREIVALALEI